MTAATAPSPPVLAVLRVAAAQRRGTWVSPTFIGRELGRTPASVGASARSAIAHGWLRRNNILGGPVYRITAAGRTLAETPDTPPGWERLPGGYALPGMTRGDGSPVYPICYLTVGTPAGPSAACNVAAVFGHLAEPGYWSRYDGFACAHHVTDVTPAMIGREEEA